MDYSGKKSIFFKIFNFFVTFRLVSEYITATQDNIDQQIFGDPVSKRNISAGDIVKKIKNLKTNSAAGPDNISAKFLQTFNSQVSIPLELIFNNSLQTGEVPADWKCGNIYSNI